MLRELFLLLLILYSTNITFVFVCWISGILGHREPDSNSNWLCISNTTNTIGILYFRSTWLIRGGISLQFSSDLSAENCQDFRWRKSLLQQETNPGVSNCFLHTKAFDYYWLEKKSLVFLKYHYYQWEWHQFTHVFKRVNNCCSKMGGSE